MTTVQLGSSGDRTGLQAFLGLVRDWRLLAGTVLPRSLRKAREIWLSGTVGSFPRMYVFISMSVVSGANSANAVRTRSVTPAMFPPLEGGESGRRVALDLDLTRNRESVCAVLLAFLKTVCCNVNLVPLLSDRQQDAR